MTKRFPTLHFSLRFIRILPVLSILGMGQLSGVPTGSGTEQSSDPNATGVGVETVQADSSAVLGTAALFANNAYVDLDGEVVNTRASLETIGLTVTTFTGITAADWSAAFAADFVVIPELENASPTLDAAAVAAINAGLAGGSGLIVMGSANSNDENFLNAVRGWSLVDGANFNGQLLSKAPGLLGFVSSPDILQSLNGTYPVVAASLPPTAIPVYRLTGGSTTSVFIDEGVGFLAYDWYDGPNADWEAVLSDMMLAIQSPPTGPPVLVGPFTVRSLAGRAFSYQIRAGGAPTGFGATGLPDGLTLDPATGLITGIPTTGGVSEVIISATNDFGTSTESLAVTIVEIPPLADLRIVELLATGSRVVDHNSLTGDDRGGVAVSASRVFVTGDSATASYDLIDLSAGVSLGRLLDGLCSDLATGMVYTLAFDGVPYASGGSSINQLLELDATTGAETGLVIDLTETIPVGSGSGVFSGNGRVAIHNGTEVYDIVLASGIVIPLGPMARPSWTGGESWAHFGVAEYFSGELYLAFRSGNSINRSRVPDGLTETISTFTNLGDLGSWTISPVTNRWYFHHEGSSQFGGSSETLGYADAVIEAGPPTAPPVLLLPPTPPILDGWEFSYQIRAGGSPTSFGATGLPDGLTIDPLTGLITGIPTTAGVFEVEISVTNIIGTSTESVTFEVLSVSPPTDFRILSLEATGSRVIDHNSLTGDDRGGIAVASDRVFVTGDSSTAVYNLEDLSGGASLGVRYDGLCSDLRTGLVFTLALDGSPHQSGGTSINQLLGLDPVTGALNGLVIPLTQTIPLVSGSGVFSGGGRVAIHNGSEVFDILVPSGAVIPLGPMSRPSWAGSESWAIWGVAEYFAGSLHLAYRSGNNIERTRVPDGLPETIASFTNLSDLASWTVSPVTSRWYFHHEGSSQFGGSSETLGYADALIEAGPPTEPPVILGPFVLRGVTSQAVSYQIRATGSPTLFEASGLPAGLTVHPTTGMISGLVPTVGEFPLTISVTNAIGTAVREATLTVIEIPAPEEVRILSLQASGSLTVDCNSLAGDDRGGIAVTRDKVFTTGDISTASFNLADLADGTSVGRSWDGIFSDLGTGSLYTFALDGIPFISGRTSINEVQELDPLTGDPTGLVIHLSEAVPVTSASGVFAGNGRVVIHNGSSVFDIVLADGAVTNLGLMRKPDWLASENWAAWGVAEYYGGNLYLAYRMAGAGGNAILRTRVPDGLPEVIATFSNLGEISSWTISPTNNRWYFQHEGSSQFGTFSENIGYADAVIEIGPPTAPPIVLDPRGTRTLVGEDFRLEVQAAGSPTAYGATGLPSGVTIDPATGIIAGRIDTVGEYPVEVSVTNTIGTTTETFVLTALTIAPADVFRILTLSDTDPLVVDTTVPAGDDRAGIAVSPDRVFMTGDTSTVTYASDDLGSGASLGWIYDGLCSDLATGMVYTLARDGEPHVNGGSSVNQLLELDPLTGRLTGLRIDFSEAIPLIGTCGVFSGGGRVVLHNGSGVYDIALSSGTVTPRGTMTRPAWGGSESWAVWGVAEFFGEELHLAYRGSGVRSNMIVRSRVPDGLTETITAFDNLGDLSSWTVSLETGRWYFTHEGSSQFGSFPENLGSADALIESGPPTEAPLILGPLTARFAINNFAYRIRAGGSPTSFGATGLPDGVTLDPLTGILSGRPDSPGEYTFEISATNIIGTSTETLTVRMVAIPPVAEFRIVSLANTGAQVTNSSPLLGDDRGGIAVSGSRVFASGDTSTGSFDLDDLTDTASLGRILDGLCSDLTTGTVYTLGIEGVPHLSGGSAVSQLLELDSESGELTGLTIDFSETISLPSSACGVFSGAGRVVIYNGTEVFDIVLSSGDVTNLGAMTRPVWYNSESWAVWGVAEFFAGEIHLAYRDGAGSLISRSRVPDGMTETIATFTNLGQMASWTVSPLTNRWYFQHESTSEFSTFSETLGYADAIIETGTPTAPPTLLGPFTARSLVDREFSYQIRAGGSPTGFGATGLPDGLTVDAASGLISGIPTTGGDFEVVISATNEIGTSSESLALKVIVIPPMSDLRIVELLSTGSRVIDHNSLTGDDRGGVAVSLDRVFVTGDSSTAHYALADLTGGVSLGTVYDGLCSDLATGMVYTLGIDGAPYRNGGSSINQLLELDGTTGVRTGLVIDLTETISVTGSGGIFSGNGRVMIYNGSAIYDIVLGSGAVIPLGPMTRPAWGGSENWAHWGVAESFDGQLHLAYRSGNSFMRSRVPDGLTETIATFTNLSDLASWTVSPLTNRWYFHHESSSQFGGSSETLGYADAVIEAGPPTAPPVIVEVPDPRAASGREFNLQIRAGGSPTEFGATGLPDGLTIDPLTGLITGIPTVAGIFAAEISATNIIGTSTLTLNFEILGVPALVEFRIMDLLDSGAQVVDLQSLAGDDRGGIAVSTDRVFVTGDSGTARFDLTDLSGGARLGTNVYDGLCSDLLAGMVYTMANDGVPFTSGGVSINQLLELDPMTGDPTGLVINLTEGIPVANGSGVFSGGGRVVIHNGTEVFEILVPSGIVIPLGPMARPSWAGSESWAVWGVAEFFAGEAHIAYRAGNSIQRARLPDGLTETIATFTNLGDLTSWTVSPFTNRWYFQHERSSQFSTFSETLGYADALIESGPPTAPPTILRPFTARSLVDRGFSYQIRAGGSPTGFGATGLPDGLTVDPASGLISGIPTAAGEYEITISATNEIGTSSESLFLTVIEIPPMSDLRIVELLDTGSQVVDHNVLTGDDRGGVVASLDRVFVTGDSSTAHYAIANLTGGVSLGTVYDGLCSDLATGMVYTMAFDGAPYRSGGASINQLIELDGATGTPTGLVIDLTETIPIVGGGGIFSGNGRVLLYNGAAVYDIVLESGAVISLGAMTRPAWGGGENWAHWGVGESFGGQLYLAYRSGNDIKRSRVPDGLTETISSFANLGDLGSWTVSPLNNRWYFHHEGGSQFGGGGETLGFADAVIEAGPPTAPPVFLTLDDPRTASGREFNLQIRATGAATSFGATGLPDGLTINPLTGLITGIPTVAGVFAAEISATNIIGTSTLSLGFEVLDVPPLVDLRIADLLDSGAQVVDIQSLAGDDRGGIAVSNDRVFVTGDSGTARFDLTDLSGGARLGTNVYDGLCSDLATGMVYTMANDGVPFTSGGVSINQLLELDPMTGAPTGLVINLTEVIPVANGSGVFSGGGRVVIHNGTEVFEILVPSGIVTPLGPMTKPTWAGSESWAVWGVAEFFEGEAHIAYRSGNSIMRARVPDGLTETIATFTNLGDLTSWTVSPLTNRWYFQHESSSQFSSFGETLGFADAIIETGPPTEVPVILSPLETSVFAGREFSFRIRASGSVTLYEAAGLPAGLALEPATGLISGVPTIPGIYPVDISATNVIGTTTATMEISILSASGTVALFADDAYVDMSREGPNTQASLESLGFVVLPFTGVSTSDWDLAFASDVVIVPELEKSSPVLSAEVVDVINSHLATGKGLVVLGSVDSNEENFLNAVSGWSLVDSVTDNTGPFPKAAGFPEFDRSPVSLAGRNGTYLMTTASLPPTAQAVYGLGPNTVVFFDGQVGYAGYDWYDGPDAGWEAVLFDLIQAVYRPTTPEITSPLEMEILTGALLSYQIEATASPRSYGAIGLPDGLLLDTTTGLLEGTVATAGIYPIELLATNVFGTVAASLILVAEDPLTFLFDPFDPEIHETMWAEFSGTVEANEVARAAGPGGFGKSLWFGGEGSRFATTAVMDVRSGGEVSFFLAMGNGVAPWDAPEAGDEVVLEYSVDGWASATPLGGPYSNTAWQRFVVAIPPGAQSDSTQFRFRQLANDGTGNDHWAIDDVKVGQPPASLPPSFFGMTFTVRQNASLTVGAGKILRYAYDPDGDPLRIVSVDGTSSQGGTVTFGGGVVTYAAPLSFLGTDRFNFTLTDGVFPVIGTITVEVTAGTGAGAGNVPQITMMPGGASQVSFFGIPGFTYGIQRSPDLINWIQIATPVADPQGRIVIEDPDPPVPNAYYRLVYPAR